MLKGIVNGVQKDITRIAMKGKQLYDSAHSTAYAAVLDANNMWVNASTAKSIKIRVEPSTQYTLSIDSPNNSIFRICESDNADITPQSASSAVELTRIVRDTTIKQYTFTTSDSAQCIIFQGSSTSYEQWNSTLMFNIGSTALPYEPYGMQQGWEVRDQNGAILWAANKTITANAGSLSYRGYGLPLKGVEVEGNMTQTGTPTSDNPIWPEECGDKTGNLFDKDNTETLAAKIDVASSRWLTSNGATSVKIPCEPSTTYTLALADTVSIFRVAESYLDDAEPNTTGTGTSVVTVIHDGSNVSSFTFTTSSSAKWIVFQGSAAAVSMWKSSLMLVEGFTALPYEPYGYKLTITNAGQTTPIYLGQAQTVRKIRKLVLDGTEEWSLQSLNRFGVANFSLSISGRNFLTRFIMCTHYGQQNTSIDNTKTSGIYNGSNIYIRDASITSLTNFKSYLATQYAAGTPVTIWYVLATPETGIVNEPIRKIGDYADTLTVTDQDVTITPAVGNDTLSVDTTLPPSKISLTGHIKALT